MHENTPENTPQDPSDPSAARGLLASNSPALGQAAPEQKRCFVDLPLPHTTKSKTPPSGDGNPPDAPKEFRLSKKNSRTGWWVTYAYALIGMLLLDVTLTYIRVFDQKILGTFLKEWFPSGALTYLTGSGVLGTVFILGFVFLAVVMIAYLARKQQADATFSKDPAVLFAAHFVDEEGNQLPHTDPRAERKVKYINEVLQQDVPEEKRYTLTYDANGLRMSWDPRAEEEAQKLPWLRRFTKEEWPKWRHLRGFVTLSYAIFWIEWAVASLVTGGTDMIMGALTSPTSYWISCSFLIGVTFGVPVLLYGGKIFNWFRGEDGPFAAKKRPKAAADVQEDIAQLAKRAYFMGQMPEDALEAGLAAAREKAARKKPQGGPVHSRELSRESKESADVGPSPLTVVDERSASPDAQDGSSGKVAGDLSAPSLKLPGPGAILRHGLYIGIGLVCFFEFFSWSVMSAIAHGTWSAIPHIGIDGKTLVHYNDWILGQFATLYVGIPVLVVCVLWTLYNTLAWYQQKQEDVAKAAKSETAAAESPSSAKSLEQVASEVSHAEADIALLKAKLKAYYKADLSDLEKSLPDAEIEALLKKKHPKYAAACNRTIPDATGIEKLLSPEDPKAKRMRLFLAYAPAAGLVVIFTNVADALFVGRDFFWIGTGLIDGVVGAIRKILPFPIPASFGDLGGFGIGISIALVLGFGLLYGFMVFRHNKAEALYDKVKQQRTYAADHQHALEVQFEALSRQKEELEALPLPAAAESPAVFRAINEAIPSLFPEPDFSNKTLEKRTRLQHIYGFAGFAFYGMLVLAILPFIPPLHIISSATQILEIAFLVVPFAALFAWHHLYYARHTITAEEKSKLQLLLGGLVVSFIGFVLLYSVPLPGVIPLVFALPIPIAAGIATVWFFLKQDKRDALAHASEAIQAFTKEEVGALKRVQLEFAIDAVMMVMNPPDRKQKHLDMDAWETGGDTGQERFFRDVRHLRYVHRQLENQYAIPETDFKWVEEIFQQVQVQKRAQAARPAEGAKRAEPVQLSPSEEEKRRIDLYSLVFMLVFALAVCVIVALPVLSVPLGVQAALQGIILLFASIKLAANTEAEPHKKPETKRAVPPPVSKSRREDKDEDAAEAKHEAVVAASSAKLSKEAEKKEQAPALWKKLAMSFFFVALTGLVISACIKLIFPGLPFISFYIPPRWLAAAIVLPLASLPLLYRLNDHYFPGEDEDQKLAGYWEKIKAGADQVSFRACTKYILRGVPILSAVTGVFAIYALPALSLLTPLEIISCLLGIWAIGFFIAQLSLKYALVIQDTEGKTEEVKAEEAKAKEVKAKKAKAEGKDPPSELLQQLFTRDAQQVIRMVYVVTALVFLAFSAGLLVTSFASASSVPLFNLIPVALRVAFLAVMLPAAYFMGRQFYFIVKQRPDAGAVVAQGEAASSNVVSTDSKETVFLAMHILFLPLASIHRMSQGEASTLEKVAVPLEMFSLISAITLYIAKEAGKEVPSGHFFMATFLAVAACRELVELYVEMQAGDSHVLLQQRVKAYLNTAKGTPKKAQLKREIFALCHVYKQEEGVRARSAKTKICDEYDPEQNPEKKLPEDLRRNAAVKELFTDFEEATEGNPATQEEQDWVNALLDVQHKKQVEAFLHFLSSVTFAVCVLMGGLGYGFLSAGGVGNLARVLWIFAGLFKLSEFARVFGVGRQEYVIGQEREAFLSELPDLLRDDPDDSKENGEGSSVTPTGFPAQLDLTGTHAMENIAKFGLSKDKASQLSEDEIATQIKNLSRKQLHALAQEHEASYRQALLQTSIPARQNFVRGDALRRKIAKFIWKMNNPSLQEAAVPDFSSAKLKDAVAAFIDEFRIFYVREQLESTKAKEKPGELQIADLFLDGSNETYLWNLVLQQNSPVKYAREFESTREKFKAFLQTGTIPPSRLEEREAFLREVLQGIGQEQHFPQDIRSFERSIAAFIWETSGYPSLKKGQKFSQPLLHVLVDEFKCQYEAACQNQNVVGAKQALLDGLAPYLSSPASSPVPSPSREGSRDAADPANRAASLGGDRACTTCSFFYHDPKLRIAALLRGKGNIKPLAPGK